MARRCEKLGFLLWIFAERCGIGGVYWSVIGHRLRVGAMGVKGKVQEWCRLVWMRVEMWERGVSGNRRLKVSCVRAIGMDRVQATSENYDVRGTGDEFGSWFGLNLLYR
jgi:hypothetical protein